MCIVVCVSFQIAAATAKLLQLCPTLCDPIGGSPPGSPVPGILQARTLEWIAISFSNAWKWKVKGKSLSHVWLLATSWTAAYQAPHPWDFPGKSTGVGCHCLLRYHLLTQVLFILFSLILKSRVPEPNALVIKDFCYIMPSFTIVCEHPLPSPSCSLYS